MTLVGGYRGISGYWNEYGNYFMTKQVVWIFTEFFFLQFDTKFASNQQRLAKIGTILWLLISF